MGQLQINQIIQSCKTRFPKLVNGQSHKKKEEPRTNMVSLNRHDETRNVTASGWISVSDRRLHTQLMSLSYVLSLFDRHSMAPSFVLLFLTLYTWNNVDTDKKPPVTCSLHSTTCDTGRSYLHLVEGSCWTWSNRSWEFVFYSLLLQSFHEVWSVSYWGFRIYHELISCCSVRLHL